MARIAAEQPYITEAMMLTLLPMSNITLLKSIIEMFEIEPSEKYLYHVRYHFNNMKCICQLLRKPSFAEVRQPNVDSIMALPWSRRTKLAIECNTNSNIISKINFRRTADVEALIRSQVDLSSLDPSLIENRRVRRLISS